MIYKLFETKKNDIKGDDDHDMMMMMMTMIPQIILSFNKLNLKKIK